MDGSYYAAKHRRISFHYMLVWKTRQKAFLESYRSSKGLFGSGACTKYLGG